MVKADFFRMAACPILSQTGCDIFPAELEILGVLAEFGVS
jgi:hypothetical protein